MIVYLANKTRFREKPHGKGAQASCLFLEDEQATDPKATGRMPMLLSNLFVGESMTRRIPNGSWYPFREGADTAHSSIQS